MVTITHTSDPIYSGQPFKAEVELEGSILKSFIVNEKAFIQGGICCTSLKDTDIRAYKERLEEEFRSHFPNYKSFTIERQSDDQYILKPSSMFSIFSGNLTIKPEFAEKIHEHSMHIQDRLKGEKIFGKTKTHNIEQLDLKPDTNPKITKILIIALVIGFFTGLIGLGGFLPQVGAISPSPGIVGIPLGASIPMMAVGLLTMAAYFGLRITARVSGGKAKEYLEDIHLKKSQWFLESNLNDIAGGLLFVFMAMTFIHAPWMTTLQGCLAYPAGVLMVGSGIYQMLESSKAIANANKVGDKKEAIKSWLNWLFGAALIGIGALTVVGMVNATPSVVLNLIAGALTVAVAGWGIFSAYKTLREVNKVDGNDPTQIMNFLKDNLNVNEKEIDEIKAKVSKMTKEDILKWIKNNYKNWEQEQKEKWYEIKQKIEAQKDIELEEIQKLIINEEIKNAIERKIENFSSLVNEDTLREALHAVENYRENPLDHKDDLIKLFAKAKREIRCKAGVEIVKFLLLYIPLMIIPTLHMYGGMGVKAYDYLMASLLFLSLSINITPRFRNVPPTTLKKALDINKELDAYPEVIAQARTVNQIAQQTLKTAA